MRARFFYIKAILEFAKKNLQIENMNHKILDTLEYEQITQRLAAETITKPAAREALDLVPSSDPQAVEQALNETNALANLLRVKGQLPLTDFASVTPSLKRLKAHRWGRKINPIT